MHCIDISEFTGEILCATLYRITSDLILTNDIFDHDIKATK